MLSSTLRGGQIRTKPKQEQNTLPAKKKAETEKNCENDGREKRVPLRPRKPELLFRLRCMPELCYTYLEQHSLLRETGKTVLRGGE